MRRLLLMASRKTMIWGGLVIILALLIIEFQILSLQTTTNEELTPRNYEWRRHGNIENPQAAGQLMADGDTVVLYNRVPKTGSTTFTNFVYDLSKKNNMYVAHINTTKNSHTMSLQDQYRLIQNITDWKDFRPAFFHGHMAYLDFGRFRSPVAPMYINIVRDPLDRLVSYYYFLRNGDDYRKGLRRARQGDMTTFDECVKTGRRTSDCAPEKLWLQIPFFCGQTAECWNVGSEWALQEAKHNLASNYLLVGLTEQMEDFVVVLEAILPRMFQGMINNMRTGTKSHIRKTLKKQPPSEETIAKFKKSKIWQMEMEFYNFAKEQFEFIKKQSTVLNDDNLLVPAPKKFRYEKIYGPDGLIQK